MRTPAPVAQEVDFVVLGKLGVRGPERGYSARFRWLQTGASYVIDVWGPLGQGHTVLAGDAGRMVVTRGPKRLAEGHPEEVMAAHLGWSVPVDVLPFWITGAPALDMVAGEIRHGEDGSIKGFVQAGWNVALSGHRAAGERVVPGKIVARRGDDRVTVVVREYTE